jgi:hypothetical protein
MFLPMFVFPPPSPNPQPVMVCRYQPDRGGASLELRADGTIRFLSKTPAQNSKNPAQKAAGRKSPARKRDSIRADVFRRKDGAFFYRIVMPGRTDTFQVSEKAQSGTETVDLGDVKTTFTLRCEVAAGRADGDGNP